jgi:hypothetical protein
VNDLKGFHEVLPSPLRCAQVDFIAIPIVMGKTQIISFLLAGTGGLPAVIALSSRRRAWILRSWSQTHTKQPGQKKRKTRKPASGTIHSFISTIPFLLFLVKLLLRTAADNSDFRANL